MDIEKGKDYSISVIRLLAIMLVIFCHIFEQSGYIAIGNYFSVGVQVFLIISGFLYGSKESFTSSRNRIVFLKNGFKKILIDYYVYCLLFAIPIYYILGKDFINLDLVLGVLTCSGTIWGIHHLWYIPYILFCYLITPLLYDLKIWLRTKNNSFYLLFILFSLVLLQVVSLSFGSFFAAPWIICYIIGFFIPESFRRKIKFFSRVSLTLFIIVLSLILNMIKVYYLYYLKLQIDLFYQYAQVSLGLSIFVILYVLLYKADFKNTILKKILDYNDKYSYDIYLAHMIYIKGVLSVIGVTSVFTVDAFLAIILSVISGIILYYVCVVIKKISNKIFKKTLGVLYGK